MSAILGIYFLDEYEHHVDPSDLERMMTSLAHRGLDGSGSWLNGPIALGHRMLWTTPQSLTEKLPLVHKTNETNDSANHNIHVLTADARIDNRYELINALDFPLAMVNQITDGQLILAAYQKWGQGCPQKLLGDFAFAIWDEKQQLLFCARDRFGVKPFYYYLSDKIFVFASEIKALFCWPQVPRHLNEVRIAEYLEPIFEDKSITLYQDIFRFPPAHSMTIGREGVKLESYWSLDPSFDIRYKSDAEYAEAFREIFSEAVRCRLRSAFPAGAMLSGGLDSSSIVCMARHILKEEKLDNLRTFSAIFDDLPQCDERAFINPVLEAGGLEPHYVHADKIGPLADLERVFHHEDEAFYAPNLFIHWALYKAARQQGVRIIMDGLDGDHAVSHGIAYLDELARSGRWIALLIEVNGLSKRFNRSAWKILWKHGVIPIRALAPKPVKRAWRWLRRSQYSAPMFNTLINPDFAKRIGLSEHLQSLTGFNSNPPRNLREDHWRSISSGVFPFMLEIADKAAAAFSLEPRYPFFDKRLIEFCLALPPQQKINHGWTRFVMRGAMEQILPPKVQWRGGKSDMSPNFTRSLITYERDTIEAILKDPKVIAEYVDIVELRQAYDRYLSQGQESEALTIWKAVTLALWLKHTGLTP